MITAEVKYNSKQGYHEIIFKGATEDKDSLDVILSCMADTRPPRRGIFVPSKEGEQLVIQVADITVL